MKPIDDTVGKHWLEQQLYTMEAQKRLLLATDADAKNEVGMAYDAGYLACLTELHAIIFNPTTEQRKAQNVADFELEFDLDLEDDEDDEDA